MLFTLCWRASHSGLAGLQDLADRYGKPLIVLNLVKGAEKRPRESILQSEFANAISYINKGVRIQFHPGWRGIVAAQLFWRISCSRVRSAGWEVTLSHCNLSRRCCNPYILLTPQAIFFKSSLKETHLTKVQSCILCHHRSPEAVMSCPSHEPRVMQKYAAGS